MHDAARDRCALVEAVPSLFRPCCHSAPEGEMRYPHSALLLYNPGLYYEVSRLIEDPYPDFFLDLGWIYLHFSSNTSPDSIVVARIYPDVDLFVSTSSTRPVCIRGPAMRSTPGSGGTT